jgi:hypothetical protein
LSLQARPWTTLALVPASSGAPADFTLKVGVALSRTGMVHLASPIHVADGTDLQLSNVMAFLDEIRACRTNGDRVLIALAPVSENPATESVAQFADCSLLCVLFESMSSADAKRTIGKIGKARFAGSTIFRPGDLHKS